jgi:hypothetical protein
MAYAPFFESIRCLLYLEIKNQADISGSFDFIGPSDAVLLAYA